MKFIFEVRVKAGFSVDEYAANWIRASEIIQLGTCASVTAPERS